jgi:hypothetical protein
MDKASNLLHPQVDMEAPISEEDLVAKVASDKGTKAEESQACYPPQVLGSVCPHPCRLKRKLKWWQANASRQVVKMIEGGVSPPGVQARDHGCPQQ